MRIVGGSWRGRAIEAPEGRDVTRPTTDRTREAMASMVLSAFGLDLSGVRILDAFAGSGAIGLELLSRGASSCCFVDRDRQSAGRVRRNARALGAEGLCSVLTGDVMRLAGGRLPGGPFSLVVLDPPYALGAGQVSALVETLASSGQLEPSALVLYEHDRKSPGLGLPAARLVKEKSRAATAVSLYRMGDKA
ncbi:RsmD family RNA methyltransferase [Olsenella urininfantis]|uniref:RsmD family RNA methyltransferase n=1 Tax=Olsenella urininfantis TaxID=1871033 RepID=UPI0009863601|nr:RsmD family RNA methyltransferase [Olsenella urininfantis]